MTTLITAAKETSHFSDSGPFSVLFLVYKDPLNNFN